MEAKKLQYIDWWQQGERPKPVAPVEPAPIVEEKPIVVEEPQIPTQPQMPTQGVPYIQPLVVVPYVSTQQPMYYYNPNQPEEKVSAKYYEDLFDNEESYALDDEESVRSTSKVKKEKVKTAKKKKANACAIISLILGIVYVAMLFDFSGMLEGFNYNHLYDGQTAFGVIMGLVTSITSGTFALGMENLVPILVVASVVLSVITALCSLFTVVGKTSVAVKVIALLALVANVGMVVVAMFIANIKLETYGMVILAVLALVIFILTACARGKKRARK